MCALWLTVLLFAHFNENQLMEWNASYTQYFRNGSIQCSFESQILSINKERFTVPPGVPNFIASLYGDICVPQS